MKRYLALLLAAMLVIGDTVPAFAQTPSYTTASGSAYAETVTETEAVPAEEGEAVPTEEGVPAEEGEVLDAAADGMDPEGPVDPDGSAEQEVPEDPQGPFFTEICAGEGGYLYVTGGPEPVETQSYLYSEWTPYGITPEGNRLMLPGRDIQAFPNEGMVFAGWEKSFDECPLWTEGERHWLRAKFETGIRVDFVVEAEEEGAGEVLVQPIHGDYREGDLFAPGTRLIEEGSELYIESNTFIDKMPFANAYSLNENYMFLRWSGIPEDGILTENTTITAVFASYDEQDSIYQIRITPDGMGYFTVNDGKKELGMVEIRSYDNYVTPVRNTLYVGDDVVTAHPDQPKDGDGYVFTGWEIPDDFHPGETRNEIHARFEEGVRVDIELSGNEEGIFSVWIDPDDLLDIDDVLITGTMIEARGESLWFSNQIFCGTLAQVKGESRGYCFKEWSGIPEDGILTENTTITAVFERSGNPVVSISATEGGKLDTTQRYPSMYTKEDVFAVPMNTKMRDSGDYKLRFLGQGKDSDFSRIIEAKVEAGYGFSGWYVVRDDGSRFRISSSCDYTVSCNMTIVAVFQELPKTCSITVGYVGCGTITPYQVIANYGDRIITDGNKLYVGDEVLEATPDYGYKFESWGYVPSRVTSPTFILVTFAGIYQSVEISAGEGGKISALESGRYIEYKKLSEALLLGTYVSYDETKLTFGSGSIYPSPDAGYEFDHWTFKPALDEKGRITGDTKIRAVFRIFRPTLTLSCTEGGSISPAESFDTAYNTPITAEGNKLKIGEKEITATPEAGYSLVSWEGIPANGYVTEDLKVEAKFVLDKYTVRVYSTSGGTVDIPNIKDIVYGTEIKADGNQLTAGNTTVTATAGERFDFIGWEGLPEPDKNGCRSIKSDLTIRAVFRPQITGQPKNQEVISGQKAGFMVEVNGMDELQYQYQWQSSADGETWADINSATDAKLSVDANSANNQYQYRCLVCYGEKPAVNDAATAISEAALLTVKENRTVTFNMQGHGEPAGSQSVPEGTAAKEPDLPAAEGYTFGGWYKEASCRNAWNFAWVISEDTTLYAKWTENKYTVTYELDGGTNSSKNPKSYTVSTATVTLANPTKKGCTFAGWYSDSEFKTKVTKITKGSTGNRTFYAKWTETKYTVTYGLNGGTNSSKNPKTYTVSTATITLTNPTKTGCTFAGWYSDSKFTAPVSEIPEGSTGNKTFYAKWTENTYTITYKLNGGKEGTRNPETYTVSTATITLAAPSKTGCTFAGWYSDSKYTTKVTKIAKRSTGNKVFYAKWTETKYTVTYELDGGTNSSKNPKSYTVSTSTITLESPKKTAYTFAGWYSDSEFKTKVTKIAKGSTGNKVFYAKWTETKYTVTYSLNGGTNSSKNPKTYTVSTATITLENPKKTGCTFDGWYSDSKFTAPVSEIPEGSTGNKTFYAKWSENTYTITYKLNGGKEGSKNPETYTVSTPTITLAAPTKTGCSFAGWYSDSKFTTKATRIAKGSTGNKVFYAKWTETKYTVTYELDGGTNSSKNPKSYTVSTSTITLVSPTKTGYTFVGWYADSGFKTKVTKISKGSTGNKTFYAKWKKK